MSDYLKASRKTSSKVDGFYKDTTAIMGASYDMARNQSLLFKAVMVT